MDKKTNAYDDSDFVEVVDANDVPLPDPVPKRWLGTDLLAPGVKKATAKSVDKTPEPVEIPEGLPAESWTVPQLTKWASLQEPPVDLEGKTKKDDIVAIVVKPTV
jgi:hypothetical protein